MTLRLATLITTSLCAVVVAVYVSLFAGSNTPAVSAEEFLVRIPDQLPVSPGQFVHTRTETWERHGPKAAVIEAAGQRPERTIAESWFEVGEGPVVVRAISTLSDSTGMVIQRATLGERGSRTVDARTGHVLDENPVQTSPPLDGQARTAARLRASLEAGARIVSRTSDLLTIEFREAPPQPRSDDDPGDWTIPYVSDLEPTEYVHRVTLNALGTVTIQEMYVVDQTGSEILVVRSETTIEILGRAPSRVFEGT